MSKRPYSLLKYRDSPAPAESGGDYFSEAGTGARILTAQIEITDNKILKKAGYP
ncbi:MAG TPA: hypothetical protein VF604_12025 [Pyrinomonadaceae bacterium]|jgi:hypothetical protein